MLFDYPAAARRIGLTEEQLGRLCAQMRPEFPDDEMLFELHVLRAILAVESGRLPLDQILQAPEHASTFLKSSNE